MRPLEGVISIVNGLSRLSVFILDFIDAAPEAQRLGDWVSYLSFRSSESLRLLVKENDN